MIAKIILIMIPAYHLYETVYNIKKYNQKEMIMRVFNALVLLVLYYFAGVLNLWGI